MELLVEDAGRLEALDAELLPEGRVAEDEDDGLVSVGLPAAEVDAEGLEEVPVPVAALADPEGRVEPELEVVDPVLESAEDPGRPVAEDPLAPGLPGFDVLELLLAVAADASLAAAVFFSAVRSMVTGRLPVPVEEEVAPLPGLSDEPEPLPPDEDVPPEDFLSVAISSPPEPNRFQDLHYTHLFAKRYRRGKDFCALQ